MLSLKSFFQKQTLNGTYQILAGGTRWSVESAKIHNCYAFTDGWPTLCERLKIFDEDLLIFNKIDNVSFQLSVYRDCIPVVLSDIVDSVDDDEVVEISHGQFVDELDKRLPVEVANRAGFKKKRHSLKVQNLEGNVVVYIAKTEKNGSANRYSVENWQKFMDDNNFIDGMMLDFTFLTSKNTIILKNVRSG
ncbi:putative DNA-binding pseudobarrel domain superfamily [Helianthus anomalus]